ncbi:hypothetical protein SFRURICE_013982 [Spodoptera frugiperda]|nr:hypothetical protein SFRURICE_013982 [Spodoptera frugiperda]
MLATLSDKPFKVQPATRLPSVEITPNFSFVEEAHSLSYSLLMK